MCREGGSIPVTLTLQEASKKSTLLLPVGAGDDMAHSQNEKINVSNYIEGVSLILNNNCYVLRTFPHNICINHTTIYQLGR